MKKTMRILVAAGALATAAGWVPVVRAQAHVELIGSPQVKDDLFAGTEKFAQGAVEATDVNLDPSMLGMLNGKDGDLAKKMNFVVVHSYRYPKPGMYKMEDVDAYRAKLKSGNWNCFIHSVEKDTGESTDICSRPGSDGSGNNEMAIVTAEPQELTFVHISGNATLADLQKLGNIGNAAGNMGQSGGPKAAPSPAPSPGR